MLQARIFDSYTNYMRTKSAYDYVNVELKGHNEVSLTKKTLHYYKLYGFILVPFRAVAK